MVLYYGTAPDAPQLLQPSNTESGVARPVAFVWQGSDPDGDALMYSLYIGTSPLSLVQRDVVAGTTYTATGLAGSTTYYWQIKAQDWKSESVSPVFSFTTQ